MDEAVSSKEIAEQCRLAHTTGLKAEAVRQFSPCREAILMRSVYV